MRTGEETSCIQVNKDKMREGERGRERERDTGREIASYQNTLAKPSKHLVRKETRSGYHPSEIGPRSDIFKIIWIRSDYLRPHLFFTSILVDEDLKFWNIFLSKYQ